LPALLLAWQSPALADPLTHTPVPCKENFPNTGVELKPCAEVKAEIIQGQALSQSGGEQGLNEMITRKIQEHYTDLGSMAWTPKLAPVASGAAPPIINACSMLGIPRLGIGTEGNVTGSAAADNHMGKACGPFVSMDVSVDVEVDCHIDWWGPVPTGVSCGLRTDYPKIKVNVHNMLPNNGMREESLMRGAFLQLIECNRATVESEINAGDLKITSDVPGMPGSCSTLAQQTMDYVEQAGQVSLGLIKTLKDANELSARMEACKNLTPAEMQAQQEAVMEAPCYLNAARSAIGAAFTSLAVCEVHARARRMFQAGFATPGPDNWVIPMMSDPDPNKGIVAHCSKVCGPDKDWEHICNTDWASIVWNSLPDIWNILDNAEDAAEACASPKATACANECYQDQILSRLQTELTNRYPMGGCGP
jgi:hypothetical protein